jgi:hypothetical protein
LIERNIWQIASMVGTPLFLAPHGFDDLVEAHAWQIVSMIDAALPGVSRLR